MALLTKELAEQIESQNEHFVEEFFGIMQVACNYCGPSGVEGCFGGAQMVPSGKYYCITNQGAVDLNYNCPYYTSLAYIRNAGDFEDWKFMRGK